MIRIRVDDFPLTKPEESYRHNLSTFEKFHDVITKYAPRYLLGCIPGKMTNEHMDFLRKRIEKIDIGMHGFLHPEDRLNEFSGVPIADIINVMRIGKAKLESLGKMVSVYMPPHNAFDHDTIKAATQVGFRYVTTGPETDASMSVALGSQGLIDRIESVPFLEYGRSDELLVRGSVDHFNKMCDTWKHDVWLTLHWTWETNIGLQHLEEYLSKLEGKFI